MESELFGYEPGAFTGASKSGKTGIFELANGGTLDAGRNRRNVSSDADEAPVSCRITRSPTIGGHKAIPVDVRITKPPQIRTYFNASRNIHSRRLVLSIKTVVPIQLFVPFKRTKIRYRSAFFITLLKNIPQENTTSPSKFTVMPCIFWRIT